MGQPVPSLCSSCAEAKVSIDGLDLRAPCNKCRAKFYRGPEGADACFIYRQGTTPTGSDIEGFLTDVAKHVKGKGLIEDIPSLDYIASSLTCLIPRFTFDFPDFKLSNNERLRIRSTLEGLANDGLASRDAKITKYWAGHRVVRCLVNALLQDAMEHGTHSWDIVVAKVLSIVLLAAFASRAGDFTLSTGYNHETVRFKDVCLKLDTKLDGAETINARIILHDKGHK